MNTNQIFRWNRFTATMRKEISENWRSLALVTLGLYLWYTITMIISNISTISGSYSVNPLFFSLIAAVMAGSAFHSLKTRQGRVDYLLSPSSTAEKYIVNLLLYVIGTFVIFAFSFQMADITRYVVMSFINAKLGLSNTLPTNLIEQFDVFQDYEHYNKTLIFALVETLGIGAVFFLGSVLWPRRSVLKTAVLVLGITILKIGIAVYWSYYYFGGHENMVPANIRNNFWDQLAVSGLWFDAIFYTLCLILAWLVLKRKDVITLKWWK